MDSGSNRPGESGFTCRTLIAVTVLVGMFGLLAISAISANTPDGRYKNDDYDFSISLPKDWKFFEYRRDTPYVTAGASNADGASVSVAVTGDDPIFGYRDGGLVCEKLRENVSRLGGFNVKCVEGRAMRRPAYFVYYAQKTDDPMRPYRFVHQMLCWFDGRVYTVSAYAPGVSEAEARDVFNRNVDELMRSLKSFWIHR